MKAVLIALCLTICILPQATKAHSSFINLCKVVDVTITGWVLYATAATEDGEITKLEVFKLSNGEKVRSQNCSGYSCNVSLSGLPSGLYSAKVYCKNTTYTEQFSL